MERWVIVVCWVFERRKEEWVVDLMVFLVGRESLVSLQFSQSVFLPSCFSSFPFSQFLSAAFLDSVLPNSCFFEILQNLRKKLCVIFEPFFFPERSCQTFCSSGTSSCVLVVEGVSWRSGVCVLV